jgi:hypothetical protein
MGTGESSYDEYRELQVAALVARGQVDRDTVRELLVWSCHSSPAADDFFKRHLGDEALLDLLLDIAVDDYSGDAQMTAAYWVSQYPTALLRPRCSRLEQVAANEWDSVSLHAQEALRLME